MIAIFTQQDGLTTAQLSVELQAWLERKADARRAQLGGFPHTPADILVELVIAAVASDPDSEPTSPAIR